MRQAIHIFRKDVRYLRWEIAVLLAVVALYALLFVRRAGAIDERGAGSGLAGMIATVLLPFLSAILIARAVHAEAIPGNRQFWITKPYRWTSLLGAKLLFIVVVTELPLLVANVTILRAYGFGLFEVAGGLLWQHMLLTVAVLLPLAALCALTAAFPELFIVCAVAGLLFVGWNVVMPASVEVFTWGPTSWIPFDCVVLIAGSGAAVVLTWQYARRRTQAGWGGAAVAAALTMAGSSMMPWTTAFAVQAKLSRKSDASGLAVRFDVQRQWLAKTETAGNGPVNVDLPLMLDKPQEETLVRAQGLRATVVAADGTAWQVKDRPWQQVETDRGITSMHLTLDRAFYRRVKQQAVTVKGQVHLTVYGPPQETQLALDGRSHRVLGLGRCSGREVGQQSAYFLFCASPFGTVARQLSVRFVNPLKGTYSGGGPLIPSSRESYAPVEARLSLIPVTLAFAMHRAYLPMTDVVLTQRDPVAFVERNFEIRDLKLGAFERGVTDRDSGLHKQR